MLQGQALEIVLNLAKQRMETLPRGELKVGGERHKGIKEVWGKHYEEAIEEVESLLSQFEDTGSYTEDDYMDE